MSHSVPSESSAIDTTFIVGTDLVEFNHRELPIYLTPESRAESYWADAGHEEVAYGAPLDRLFGEPGDVFVSGMIGSAERAAAAAAAAALSDDPLVILTGLSDGLILPTLEPSAPAAALDADRQSAAEIVTVYDFASDAHAVAHLHDGWSWDLAGGEWAFDHHA